MATVAELHDATAVKAGACVNQSLSILKEGAKETQEMVAKMLFHVGRKTIRR